MVQKTMWELGTASSLLTQLPKPSSSPLLNLVAFSFPTMVGSEVEGTKLDVLSRESHSRRSTRSRVWKTESYICLTSVV